MWIIIGITVFTLICAILIIRSAIHDAAENMCDDITRMYDEVYMENDMDKLSPDNIISDELIRKIPLRNKLNKIEKERQTETEIKTFGDFDHSRIDGK